MGSDKLSFAPHAQQWASGAHDPVTGSAVVLPWTIFAAYREPPTSPAVFRDALTQSSRRHSRAPCQTRSLHLPIFPAKTHQPTAYLPPNIFHPFNRQHCIERMLLTSPVSGFNVNADLCILNCMRFVRLILFSVQIVNLFVKALLRNCCSRSMTTKREACGRVGSSLKLCYKSLQMAKKKKPCARPADVQEDACRLALFSFVYICELFGALYCHVVSSWSETKNVKYEGYFFVKRYLFFLLYKRTTIHFHTIYNAVTHITVFLLILHGINIYLMGRGRGVHMFTKKKCLTVILKYAFLRCFSYLSSILR